MNRTTEKQRAATASAGEPSENRAGALGELIGSWIDGEDAEEQRDTMACLIRTLDDNRLSDRKLFPRELRGKSR